MSRVLLVLTLCPRDAEESDVCVASGTGDVPRLVMEGCVLSHVRFWPLSSSLPLSDPCFPSLRGGHQLLLPHL